LCETAKRGRAGVLKGNRKSESVNGMVLENEILNFLPWLLDGAYYLALVVAVLLGVSVFFGYLIAAIRHGPAAGLLVIQRVVVTGAMDAISTSPRRIFALAWLSFKESVGQRLIVVFVLFLMILMIAGWYLDPNASLSLSVLLGGSTFLVLLLALLLSAFSLPGDIKSRTIYTIVTKPVRCGEIVLGRVLGFTAVGTLFLAASGSLSYVFVVRSINHTHEIKPGDLSAVENTNQLQGQTTKTQDHTHAVPIDADGTGIADVQHGHWHEVNKTDSGYEVGPPLGALAARVPIHGRLSFVDRKGKQADKGISVGKEWTYRSYIAGSSLATANWEFKSLNEEQFRTPEGSLTSLPISLKISVFRTHKGKIEHGILGSITLRNPETQLTSGITTFRAKEFVLHEIDIPRRQIDADDRNRAIDIFDDLMSDDGRIEIIIRCEEEGQYFGMAQADVYLRSRDASFALNFIKGYLGIWLQMVIVIALGVMFSTLLSAPVTVMATLTSIVMGMFASYILKLANGPDYGGGPIESGIRLWTQRNMTSPLAPGTGTTIVETADSIYLFVLWMVISLLPDLTKFNGSNYVTQGFNVPADLLVQQVLSSAVYLSLVCVIGYFFLKTREVAR
jgi:ABC-type transport system involved in multi-copper enzyme maturation permease subunit